ncbi:MAG: uracil-DNA glycosylase family protein [Candidatus Obscuribacterales bacterium]|nr:uracil-DNA glycosylase family protein [Candidatus Obscuribacterales bacterium]
MSLQAKALTAHLEQLRGCSLCPLMIGPVVTHHTVLSKIYLCGQAPGTYEGKFGKPFAWTAGKTLFRWIQRTGVDEELFRSRAYMGAVCRCFPGKNAKGGDRVPNLQEISNCSAWMKTEFELLKPELVIPVGRLAIELFLPKQKLTESVGSSFRKELFGITCDVIPLPHPSGASTWFKVEPGVSLLAKGLDLIKTHPSWLSTFPESAT